MKVLIHLLIIIIIGWDQLEAQIQSLPTKPSQPIIEEIVVSEPTQHYQDNNVENSFMGRFVIDNSIDGDYVPFKSAFAKKNMFFLNWMNAVEQNKIMPSFSRNEIPQASIFTKKFQNSKKKPNKLDLGIKISKNNVKDRFVETIKTVKLSKSSSKSSSEVPAHIQKLNDRIDFLKFHIFGSNSSETLKQPKLTLKEFMKGTESENSSKDVSNLNSSEVPLEVQKLNDKIDFLKFHIFGSNYSSKPKLSLKEFMHEVQLELDSRRKSNINNFVEVGKLTKFHLLPKSPIEDYMQQDLDDSHKEISPNQISNELKLPRDFYAFVFDYRKILFNLRRPLVFKSLIPDFLKIPKYQEKVNRSLPKLILPFEKYETLIRFVETDDKLLPQAITLFFGELPPMPTIPPRTKQINKRSTNLKELLLPLIHKTIKFQIYDENNKIIYKLHNSYWKLVKPKISFKFSLNNTAKDLEPFLPGFYRSLDFTSDPDDLLPFPIKFLKIFTRSGIGYGPRRTKTSEYRYEFKDYNAEKNLNYLLKYFKQMRQKVLNKHLETGAHGLPQPEQTFAFYIEVPNDGKPDFENIFYWGTELLTPKYHKLYQFNDTHEEVFIVEEDLQVLAREKRLPSIELGEEVVVSKNNKFDSDEEEAPMRTKRSVQITTTFAFPNTTTNSSNNEEVTLTNSDVVKKSHDDNVLQSSSRLNNSDSNEVPPSITFRLINSSSSEYESSNIEEVKPLIKRINEIIKQRNSNFPRPRLFHHKYIHKRKNPLSKGIKKITINYDVPVYLKFADDEIEPHETYGPPQHRSRHSTIFESVFDDNERSYPRKFHEASKIENTNAGTEKSFTKIDSKFIVYGFPELFVRPEKGTLSVDKSRKISKITINYGVPVYFNPFVASSKSPKLYSNNIAFNLPVAKKVEDKQISNFLPATTKPKSLVVSDAKESTTEDNDSFGEITNYGYYLGTNPANITISHDYYSQKQTGKPQNVYGVPRIKRSSSIFNSVFNNSNFKPLQRIFFEVGKDSFPVREEAYEFPSKREEQILKNKLPVEQESIGFSTLTSKVVLPKIDEAKPGVFDPNKTINFHSSLSLPSKSFHTKPFTHLKTSNDSSIIKTTTKKVKIPSKNNNRLPTLDFPKTFSYDTENLYRISLPSSYTRYLKNLDYPTEPPLKQTFEPTLVSNYFFMPNITVYQRLHYYFAPKMNRSVSFSKSTPRSKRSVFASVFNNDGSKSLQQRFYEGIHKNVQNHQHKSNYEHRHRVETARLQYVVPSVSHYPSSNGMLLPRIRLTKYFNSKLGQNLTQLPIDTKTKLFSTNSPHLIKVNFSNSLILPLRKKYEKLTFEQKLPIARKNRFFGELPIVNKSILFSTNSTIFIKNNLNPIGIVRLQVPNFKSASFAQNDTQIPSRNEMFLPKINVTNKYTKPFEQKLPKDKSKLFTLNSSDIITSWIPKLQIPNTKGKNMFWVNRNVTKHLSVPNTVSLGKKFKLDLTIANISKPDFVLIEPKLPQVLLDNINYNAQLVPSKNSKTNFSSSPKNQTKIIQKNNYLKALEDNIKYNAQFSIGIGFDRHFGFPNGSKNHRLDEKLVNNLKNNSFVAPKVPLNQSVDYLIKTLPKVEATKKFGSTVELVKSVNLPKILKNNSFAQEEPHLPKVQATKQFGSSLEAVENIPASINLPKISKNNSFAQEEPHLPKVEATKTFGSTVELVKSISTSANLPKILKNNLFSQEEPHLPKVQAPKQFGSTFESVKNIPVNVNLPKISKNNSFTEEEPHLPKVEATKKFVSSLESVKNFPRRGNLPKILKNNSFTQEEPHLPKIKATKQFGNTLESAKNIPASVNLPEILKNNSFTQEIQYLPKVEAKKKFGSTLESVKSYSRRGNLPKILKNNSFTQEEPHLRKIEATKKFGNTFESVKNIPASVNLPNILKNDSFTKEIQNLPNVKAKKKFGSTLESVKNVSGSVDLPKILTNITFTQEIQYLPEVGATNTFKNTSIVEILPDLPREVSVKNFTQNSQLINNLPEVKLSNLPKALEENIKYNSQFIPTKTNNNPEIPPTENVLKIRKFKSEHSPLPTENPINGNNTNAKIPSVIQFEMPKIPKGYMFKENAMLRQKVSIIRQNKTLVPVFNETLKENVVYNAQFVNQQNVSRKTPEATIIIKENVTKHINNNSNKTDEPTTTEKYENPEENSIEPNQPVKHYRKRKRPANIVAQKIKESSKITNKNINRADIPIEEENSPIKNPLYVGNRANYPLVNRGTIRANNTRVNIRKNSTNLYNLNSAKSRFIVKNRTLRNNTEDALDNDVINEKKKLVRIIKRPIRKNIVVENA